MSETVAIKEHDRLFDLYDADGCLVGKANPGKKVMLADAFYAPERTCRDLTPDSDKLTCSECGAESVGQVHQKPFIDVFSYCPNCGARVEEASDDADR